MIIYFSGTQGSGKTTLIDEICSQRPDEFMAYPDRLKFPKVDSPVLRNRNKMVKYYHEYLDQLNFMKENPGKIIIGDRCPYDGLVYGRAFVDLGWMSQQDFEWNQQIARLLFPKFPDYLVLVNPPLDIIQQRLMKRWGEKEKKWREDDFSYISAAHREFSRLPEYFEGRSLLYIDRYITVKEEAQRFFKWIDDINHAEKIEERSLEQIVA